MGLVAHEAIPQVFKQMTNNTLSGNDYSLAIQILRPILIIVMCWAHIPLLQGYLHPSVTTELPASVFGTVLRDTLSRGAVPLLTVISGYLAYGSYAQKSYPRFVWDKTARILLPFLAWNAILLGGLFFLNYASERDIGGHIARIQGFEDVVLSVIGYNRIPVNAPTYFLRDLFLILLVVPLIDFATRNKFVGIALSLVLATLVLTVLPLFIVVNGHAILYRNDMPFFFITGFMFARHDFSLRYQIEWKAVVGLLSFLAACVATSFWLVAEKPSLTDFLRYRPLFGIFLVALVPCMVSLIARHQSGFVLSALAKLSPYSFIIFLSHMMIVYYLGGGFSDPLNAKLHEVNLNNLSPLWMQSLFVLFYSAMCVGLGIALKLTHEKLVRTLSTVRFRE